MDIKEASWRVLGADDFIKLFLRTLDQSQPMKSEDRKKLMSMMDEIRMVMLLKYQSQIKKTI